MLLMVSDMLVMVGGGLMVQTNSFNFTSAISLLETHVKKESLFALPSLYLLCYITSLQSSARRTLVQRPRSLHTRAARDHLLPHLLYQNPNP